MAINKGPIVFLTPGSAESLAALPGLAAFAATLGQQLTVLHPRGRADTRGRESMQRWRRWSWPPANRAAIRRAGRGRRRAGGLCRVQRRHRRRCSPETHRALDRLLLGGECERLLKSGPLPVLALPERRPRSARPSRCASSQPTPGASLGRRARCYDRPLPRAGRRAAPAARLRRRPAATHGTRSGATPHRAPNPRALLKLDQNHLSGLAECAAAQESRRARQQTYAEGAHTSEILSYAASASIDDLIVMPSHSALDQRGTCAAAPYRGSSIAPPPRCWPCTAESVFGRFVAVFRPAGEKRL